MYARARASARSRLARQTFVDVSFDESKASKSSSSTSANENRSPIWSTTKPTSRDLSRTVNATTNTLRTPAHASTMVASWGFRVSSAKTSQPPQYSVSHAATKCQRSSSPSSVIRFSSFFSPRRRRRSSPNARLGEGTLPGSTDHGSAPASTRDVACVSRAFRFAFAAARPTTGSRSVTNTRVRSTDASAMPSAPVPAPNSRTFTNGPSGPASSPPRTCFSVLGRADDASRLFLCALRIMRAIASAHAFTATSHTTPASLRRSGSTSNEKRAPSTSAVTVRDSGITASEGASEDMCAAEGTPLDAARSRRPARRRAPGSVARSAEEW